MDSSQQFTLSQAISELENLSDAHQRIVESSTSFAPGVKSDTPHILILSPETYPLSTCSFFVRIPSAPELLNQFKASELISACTQHNLEPPCHTTKANLVAWCSENAQDCFFSYTLSPAFQKVSRKVHTYLLRKFEWSYFSGGKYPCGSKQPDLTFSISASDSSLESSWASDRKYYFPDDEITALLTLYGHNRCLNGFIPIPLDEDGF